MSELVVGIMGFEAFKAHTVAIASGTETPSAKLWFADLAACGAVLNAGMPQQGHAERTPIETNHLARLNLSPAPETGWSRIVLHVAAPYQIFQDSKP